VLFKLHAVTFQRGETVSRLEQIRILPRHESVSLGKILQGLIELGLERLELQVVIFMQGLLLRLVEVLDFL
jgi:hypothetical protein